jgi:hypothetical protein
VKPPCRNAARYTIRLHGRPRLPHRPSDAVEVAVRRRPPLIDLSAARFGQDAAVTVLQHDDRALDHTTGARVPLLTARETVLQGIADDPLRAGIYCRGHLDLSLKEIINAEVSIRRCEFLQDVFDDGGRLNGSDSP